MTRGPLTSGALLAAAALVALAGRSTPPDAVTIEVPTIRAADGGVSRGVLYWNPASHPKTVVVSMHPSSDNQRHFTLRPAAEHGYAGFGLAGRFTGQDGGIHEEVLLDLAAAITWLKTERGFTHVVLVGHSGGGSLMAYYQSQATTAPPGRYKATPAGDPPDLNAYTMPPADGLAILNASEGEGLHVSITSTRRWCARTIRCRSTPRSTCTTRRTAFASRRSRAPTPRSSSGVSAKLKRRATDASPSGRVRR